jgi:LacI family transcriptional regulator
VESGGIEVAAGAESGGSIPGASPGAEGMVLIGRHGAEEMVSGILSKFCRNNLLAVSPITAFLLTFMARPPSHRVNLKNIAQNIGVSVSTVSRSLRGLSGVHPDTEAKIVAMAKKLGYGEDAEPKRGARGAEVMRHVLVLSQSRSQHVDPGYMTGISQASVELNVATLTHLVPQERCVSVLDASSAPPSLRNGLVEGLILLHSWPAEVAAKLSERLPVVSVVYGYPGTSIDMVGIDDRRGVDELVSHLYAGGHRRIGFYGLCPEVSWSRSRFASYLEALTRLDLPYDPSQFVRVDLGEALATEPFVSDEAGGAVRRLVGGGVDAWVCASVVLAESLRRSLTGQGLRVPEDVALTSFHGSWGQPGMDVPVFTSTQVSGEDLGDVALRRLIHRIEQPKECRRATLLPATLTVGATTRPVPKPAERG